MNKILAILLAKYLILFVFVFLVYFIVKFFVQSLKNVSQKDKRVLLYLLNGGFLVALGFMVYVGLMAFDYDLVKFTVVFLVSIFLGYWFFVWLKQYIARYVLIFDNRIDIGDVVEIDGEFFRVLSFKADKIFLENFDGQVVTRKVLDMIQRQVLPVKDKIWFYLDKNDINLSQLQDLINKNPYIPPQDIALIEEEDLAVREKRIKICIKQPKDFDAVLKLRKYLISSLEQE